VISTGDKDLTQLVDSRTLWINTMSNEKLDVAGVTTKFGVPPEKIAAVLDLMAYLLTPEAQAYTYDKGYFYPGPAVKNVSLSMAPKESQDAIKEYGRPEYEGWLAQFPHTQSLEPKAQVEAFRIWDQQVGTQKTK